MTFNTYMKMYIPCRWHAAPRVTSPPLLQRPVRRTFRGGAAHRLQSLFPALVVLTAPAVLIKIYKVL